MAEIVVSVIAKLTEYLVDPVVRQGKYLFCAAKITKTLETEMQRLASAEDGVQKRVREALNKTETIVDAVEKWLGEVKNHVDEVQRLQHQVKEDSHCFQGRCPNWNKYGLCRQMAKMIVTTKRLIERNEFNPFSVPTLLPDIEYLSSRNFVYFQSTKVASDQLLAALQDHRCHMIGLHGMGGSGKTTLVKEVGKRAKELKLFDRVVFATVSQSPDVREIQGEIADFLGLELDEESEGGRARRLSVRLSGGERILMILDDVWAKINLKEIGIPFEDYHMGCKILLTTRRQQVCYMMDCERKIPLRLLSDEESWTLFQKHAHIDDKSLESVAQEIVRECKGLPIAIVAVGTSLKGKSVEEWKEALRRLRDSKPIGVEDGVDRDAFACLQLSYDYLKSKEAKLIFLMCSMYPEDGDILVEDLFRIALGLGLCEDVDSLEQARNKVDASINNLIDSSLLLRSEKTKGCLRMHDTVRDVALWIAPKENHTIVVNHKKDMNVVPVESMKDCYAFASWGNEMSRIPQRLDVSKLEILLVKTSSAFESPETVYEGMEALKVVGVDFETILPKFRFLPLPHSMKLLPNNLRTLRLQGWELGDDLSWVVCLKRLEVLDMKRSSFKELPQGLQELNKLKLLDLGRINDQSFKVIERCTQLEELYASEIQLYETTLKRGGCFRNKANFPPLRRYDLKIGKSESGVYASKKKEIGVYVGRDASKDLCSRALFLRELNISTSSPFMKDLLHRAEAVYLYGLDGGCKNMVPDIFQVVGGMNEVSSLRLSSCSDLECLGDATSHHADLYQAETTFPKLIKLNLRSLPNFKEVWRGPPLLSFFDKLQELYVFDCPRLTSLFPNCVARAVLLLQKLTIESCRELKNIIEEDGIGTGTEIVPISSNSHSVFSHLKFLTIRSCDKLEAVFSNSCVRGLLQLEQVLINGASQLKYAFGHHEEEHHENLIELPVLKSLQLDRLENLLSIFPKNYHSSCPSLSELYWKECPKFTTSCVNIMCVSNMNVDNQLSVEASAPLSFLNLGKLEVEDCSVEDVLFPLERLVSTETDQQSKLISTLHTLNLQNLSELKLVWSGPGQTLSLQNLRAFRVSGCNNLKTIFSPVILRSIQMLEYLYINDCNGLEEIIFSTEVKGQHQNPQNIQPPQICFPNLQSLVVERCSKLKCLFSMAIDCDDLPENVFPNLRSLTLRQLPSLTDFCQGLSLSNHLLQDKEFQPCFPKLEYLAVTGCHKLKCLFIASSVTRWLPRLNMIDISECAELKELFIRRSEASSGNGKEILLPNLRFISLYKLPSLVDVCQGFNLCPVNIASIDMRECPKFSSIMGATGSMSIHLKPRANNGSHLLDQLPCFLPESLTLRELELQKVSELSFISTPLTSSQIWSYQSLQNLTVNQCGKLKCVFSTLVGGSLPQLSDLEIMECAEMEEIIEELEEAQHHSNADMHFSFPKLETLRVKGCNKLKYLLSSATVGMLPQLRNLEVSESAQLDELFPHKTEQGTVNTQEIVLPNLKSIQLGKLPSLTHFCKELKLNVPYLRDVQIKECPKFDFVLTEIQRNSLQPSTQRFQALEESGEGTSTQSIGDGEEWRRENQSDSEASAPQSFLSLEKVEVEGCGVKDILFPLEGVIIPHNKLISTSETLKLKNLPDLKFVWSGPMQTLSLQNLREFRVSGCNNLKNIFAPVILRSMQLLKTLYIEDCNELEIIFDAEVEEQHECPLNNEAPQICFPNLESLEVRGCNKLKCLFSMAINRNDLLEIVLPNFKRLILKEVPSLKDFCPGLSLFNDCLLQLLGSTLEELRLGSLPELQLIWRGLSQSPNHVHLRRLELGGCNKLKSVFSEDISGRSLPMLEHLMLSNCEELEEIVTEDQHFQAYFPKLDHLCVKKCNKLKCLLSTFSMTISLPHLRVIGILECGKFEELFRHKSEASSDNDKEVLLPNLRYLNLEKLPSLVDVCKGFKLEAVNLQNILIRECPEFSSIMGATGSISTYTQHSQEGKPYANNSSQLLDGLPYFFPTSLTIQELELQKLSELSFICTALAAQILRFQYLRTLRVHQCGKLKCIFSTLVQGSLPQLSWLEITECEEVEEIVEEVEEAQHLSSPNMQSSFLKLKTLTVKGCNKLRCLFRTATVGLTLPQLERIEVSDAAQLEELLSHKSEQNIVDTQEIGLPNLKALHLSDLPSLTYFCRGLRFNAPRLHKVQLNECPKFDVLLTETQHNSL